MSVAVLEALSIGTPVVVTPACNVEGIEEAGAGWVTSNEPEDLAARIGNCLGMTMSAWASMSARACRLARERYSWPRIGAEMSSVYEWLAGGPRPACVVD
jgi:poly(glycerol-phosphate) alpha-glucosyltransferase